MLFSINIWNPLTMVCRSCPEILFPLPTLPVELEPRHARNDAVSLGVDLTATQEDHMEVSTTRACQQLPLNFVQTGNTNDVTMQAGRQRAILPLIRKFNEHSERLLNSALGEVRPVKRRRLNVEEPVSTRQIACHVSLSLNVNLYRRSYMTKLCLRISTRTIATKGLHWT